MTYFSLICRAIRFLSDIGRSLVRILVMPIRILVGLCTPTMVHWNIDTSNPKMKQTTRLKRFSVLTAGQGYLNVQLNKFYLSILTFQHFSIFALILRFQESIMTTYNATSDLKFETSRELTIFSTKRFLNRQVCKAPSSIQSTTPEMHHSSNNKPQFHSLVHRFEILECKHCSRIAALRGTGIDKVPPSTRPTTPEMHHTFSLGAPQLDVFF